MVDTPISEADLQDGEVAKQLLNIPMHSHSVGKSVPLIARSATAMITLWLHCKQKRTCWYFKALHEYEAFVTTAESESGPRYTVDQLQITIQRDKDNALYTHACGKSDYCAKSDEIWYTGGACSWSIAYATATHGGST